MSRVKRLPTELVGTIKSGPLEGADIKFKRLPGETQQAYLDRIGPDVMREDNAQPAWKSSKLLFFVVGNFRGRPDRAKINKIVFG